MFTKEVAINQDLKALFPDDRLNKEYLFHWLNQKQSELESMSNGSTVKGINLNDLRKIKIKLPDQNFQIIFVQFVNLLDQEINGLNQKLKLLRIQKQGLMQKLLTGKLRVSI